MMGFDIHRLGLTMPLIDEHVLKSTHSFGVFFFFFFLADEILLFCDVFNNQILWFR